MKAKTAGNLAAYEKWKAAAVSIGFDFYTMKEKTKQRDLLREAARAEKRTRAMLASDYE